MTSSGIKLMVVVVVVGLLLAILDCASPLPWPKEKAPTNPYLEAQAGLEDKSEDFETITHDGGGGPHKTASEHEDETTAEIFSIFQNPSYPEPDTEKTKYRHTVMAQKGYCALRIEFEVALLAPRSMGTGCSTDSMVVFNGFEQPSAPVCGLLEGYQLTVRQQVGKTVLIMITSRSGSHMWKINLSQIPCVNIKPLVTYFTNDTHSCGIKNPQPTQFRLKTETPKLVPSHKMLQYDRKSLAFLMATPFLGSIRLLGQTVLDIGKEKILRGMETGMDEYPWQAVLMFNEQVLCGAVVINTEWVMTAGHCVLLSLKQALVSVLTVSLTEHDLRLKTEATSIIVGVSKIVLHEYGEGEKNDIALIKLDKKLEWQGALRPICLPFDPDETFEGKHGIISGWGKTDDWVISNILRTVEVPILTNEKCTELWAPVLAGAVPELIDPRMVCAGGGELGQCTEDPGGPLITEVGGKEDKKKKWVLVGIASFGFIKGCAVKGVPVVYTRVSEYLDWMALNFADTHHHHLGKGRCRYAHV